jgi:hypothetical protein
MRCLPHKKTPLVSYLLTWRRLIILSSALPHRFLPKKSTARNFHAAHLTCA